MKRETWIDIAKGAAILLVCAGHSQLAQIAQLNSWIASFHMAFFFMVAGYCYRPDKYGNYFQYAVRKLKALAYPYLAFSLFIALMMFVMVPDKSLVKALSETLLPYPGHSVIGFWFVRVLLATELICAIGHKRWRIAVVFFCIFAGICFAGFGQGINEPEIIRPISVLMASFFYGWGMAIKQTGIIDKLSKIGSKWTWLMVAAGLAMVQITILGIAKWPQFSFGHAVVHGKPIVFCITGVLGSMVLLAGAKFADTIPAVRSGLAYFGRNSLCLLAVHPTCGIARAAWVAKWPALQVYGASYLLELLAILGFMYLLSGPLKGVAKWPWR